MGLIEQPLQLHDCVYMYSSICMQNSIKQNFEFHAYYSYIDRFTCYELYDYDDGLAVFKETTTKLINVLYNISYNDVHQVAIATYYIAIYILCF